MAFLALHHDLDLNLAPNAVATESHSMRVEGGDTWHLLGVFPHMHKLGRTLRVQLERTSKTTCLVDVASWDFHWQQFYFYERAIDVVPGDVVTIQCSFDTAGVTSEVHWGEGTDDEMCLAGFYVTRN